MATVTKLLSLRLAPGVDPRSLVLGVFFGGDGVGSFRGGVFISFEYLTGIVSSSLLLETESVLWVKLLLLLLSQIRSSKHVGMDSIGE